MKRLRLITAYLILAAVVLAVFSGCAIEPPEEPTRPARAVVNDDPGFKQAVVRRKLTITPRVLDYGSCTIVYPYVCDNNMYLLNLSIRSAFAEFAERCEAEKGEVRYSVAFNRYGLLSLKLVYATPGGVVIATDTANFDTDTGRLIDLHDCFGSTGADYLGLLRDYVLRYVEQNGLKLIGEVPALNDGSPFLFTYDGILLVYREYELVTPDTAQPTIKIRVSSVSDIIAKDGLLNRLG